MSTSVGVGERLRQARKRSGMTQEGVVFALRDHGLTTSVSTYQRWERTGSTKAHELGVLAGILKVPQQWLAAGGDLERARVDQVVDELRADGFSYDEIAATIAGLRNVSAARDVPLADDAPGPQRSVEDLSKRHGGSRGSRAGGTRRQRGPRPPRNQDGDQP